MNEKELPQITDLGGESFINEHPLRLEICTTHTKDNWFKHIGYIDNKDHTITCHICGWGTKLPGYMRVLDGKIVDLRGVNGQPVSI